MHMGRPGALDLVIQSAESGSPDHSNEQTSAEKTELVRRKGQDGERYAGADLPFKHDDWHWNAAGGTCGQVVGW